jgi:hypothetical protein
MRPRGRAVPGSKLELRSLPAVRAQRNASPTRRPSSAASRKKAPVTEKNSPVPSEKVPCYGSENSLLILRSRDAENGLGLPSKARRGGCFRLLAGRLNPSLFKYLELFITGLLFCVGRCRGGSVQACAAAVGSPSDSISRLAQLKKAAL